METVVTAALSAGALGARMSGDGMATWVLVLTEAGATDEVRRAIDRGFAAEPGLSWSVWFEPAVPSAGLTFSHI